ncbi:hypothetical protein NM208_g2386 [Fusarium decemcellulare]|uniref:Uncharacterized protein n=1 Tax=Fusarium decemcellulare TaxID=57161 RepID=A0ACC1SST4_9HYPO|nr:hypothetical protein NM208_g2386 [Fusarium decemcellulare]
MEDRPEALASTRRPLVIRALYAIGDFGCLLSSGTLMMAVIGLPSLCFRAEVVHARLSSITFGALFRFIPFATTHHGPRPADSTFAGGFCYLHLFPVFHRWLAALRLGPYPTGASLHAYILKHSSNTFNVNHLSYELRAGILHFKVGGWKPFHSFRAPLDLVGNAKIFVPDFDSIRVGGSPARCRNIQPFQALGS